MGGGRGSRGGRERAERERKVAGVVVGVVVGW